MKTTLKIYCLALLAVLLSLEPACGPKEIGQGVSSWKPASSGGGQPAAEMMRYPLLGSSNTQKMLYHTNRPDVMEMTQKFQQSEFKQRLGLDSESEDESWQEIPKERGPFRQ